MIIVKKEAGLRAALKGRTDVGFVPTMGALHAGHRSLIERAREEGKFTVCSIFVNPTQFNEKSDFDNYPQTLPEDILLLQDAGCELLFLPSVEEVYPGGSDNTRAFSFGALENVFEGAHRPGHFRGVGQVVSRLLEMVQPNTLYLGQKDYQQCLVISDMLRQMDLPVPVGLVKGPTVREADGLAMSSRNRRLTPPHRALAPVIYQCLVSIQSKKGLTPFAVVQKECVDLLAEKGFTTEYVALADADTLAPMEDYDDSHPTVALIAARLGGIRLIDNLLLQ